MTCEWMTDRSDGEGNPRATCSPQPGTLEERFWKGCKPNFVFPETFRGRGSFVSAASTRNSFRVAKHGAGSSRVPYLALHPMGFSVPPRLRLERWALTPPFHPCRSEISNLKFEISERRFVFCGTFRRDASRRLLPRVSQRARKLTRLHRVAAGQAFAAASYAASRPLVFGLSSPPSQRARSDPPPFQNRAQFTRIPAEWQAGS